jgi:hypothetical protein
MQCENTSNVYGPQSCFAQTQMGKYLFVFFRRILESRNDKNAFRSILTRCIQFVCVKIIATEKDKKSSIFQENWKFVTVFTKASFPVSYLESSDSNCFKKL